MFPRPISTTSLRFRSLSWTTTRRWLPSLLQQDFVRSDLFAGSVEGYIKDAAKKLGGPIAFVDAIHYVKGEGIEKKQEDFAAEVAAQMNMGK